MVTRERLFEIVINVTRMAFTLGLVAIAIASVGMFGASAHPYLDWLPSFLHWYVVCGFLAAVVFALLGARRRAAVAGVLAAFHLVMIAPWLSTTPDPSPCASDAKVLVINAYIGNVEYERVVDHIRAEDPDVLFVSELAPQLHAMIKPMYPYSSGEGGLTAAAQALYSKYPIDHVELLRHSKTGVGGEIVADLATPDGTVRVLGVHPPAPGVPMSALIRNDLIEQHAEVVRTSPHPVLLIGDLNITMWSPHYLPLEDAGLVNARRGRGVKPTFPTSLPLKIPIDHVMHTADLEVCTFEVGPDINSDHLPLTATVDWGVRRSTGMLAQRM